MTTAISETTKFCPWLNDAVTDSIERFLGFHILLANSHWFPQMLGEFPSSVRLREREAENSESLNTSKTHTGRSQIPFSCGSMENVFNTPHVLVSLLVVSWPIVSFVR